MPELLFLLACLLVFSITHVVVGIAQALVLRIKLQEVRIGMGPRLARVTVRGVPVLLRVLPVSGGVVYASNEDDLTTPSDDRRTFDDVPIPIRAVASLTAPLAILGLGAAVIGGPDAVEQLRTAVPQLAKGAWSPLSTGAPLVASWFRLVNIDPVAAWGVLAIKFAVLELLPVPCSPGGNALMDLLKGGLGLRRDEGLGFGVFSAGLLLYLALQGAWAVAVVSAAL